MSALKDLDPETRRTVERAALDEIALFGAADDPAAIESLARAGRCGVAEAGASFDLGDKVSDCQEEIAAELRTRQRELAAAVGALGAVVRMMVRV
ncbi:MAG: hypothetical protein EON95_00840 [Caulobacteraceae bacterium]|nr:hypothetical protein [Caulobacter sp.]RYF95592.1 MAG: hypothetical protein EON95_00840 [Caulobacteraceae bacterium]